MDERLTADWHIFSLLPISMVVMPSRLCVQKHQAESLGTKKAPHRSPRDHLQKSSPVRSPWQSHDEAHRVHLFELFLAWLKPTASSHQSRAWNHGRFSLTHCFKGIDGGIDGPIPPSWPAGREGDFRIPFSAVWEYDPEKLNCSGVTSIECKKLREDWPWNFRPGSPRSCGGRIPYEQFLQAPSLSLSAGRSLSQIFLSPSGSPSMRSTVSVPVARGCPPLIPRTVTRWSVPAPGPLLPAWYSHGPIHIHPFGPLTAG